MLNPALHVAYGRRGVQKLLESISSTATPAAELGVSLATLNSLLSSQESKMQALTNDGAIIGVLTGLLANADADVRRQSALAIASLTLVIQGRIAAADASTVAALSGPLRDDSDAAVRAACAAALESLTTSRDGCSAVIAAPQIAAKLTEALDDESKPVVKAACAAVGSLLRLDLGVAEALSSGVVSKLKKLIDGMLDVRLLEIALQALWNLANTPDGKAQAIEAGLLVTLAANLRSNIPHVRRLAAGCTMAITIDKEGKFASAPCVEPLAELLFDPAADHSSVRDAVGALKNITEYPKARKAVDAWARNHDVGDAMRDMFDKPLFDHKQWPASLRFQHQNVAPGGAASEDEAATRERWGYPRPFSGQ